MDNKDLIFGLFALIGLIVFVAQAVLNQRSVAALTTALTAARSDDALVGQIHSMAVSVVPVETLHKALDALIAAASFAKALTTDEVDQAIDAGTSLVKKVVEGPGTITLPPNSTTTIVAGDASDTIVLPAATPDKAAPVDAELVQG